MPGRPMTPPRLRWLWFALACAWPLGPAAATAVSPSAPEQGTRTQAVTTRAIVRSVFHEDDGRRTYIRLKLVPRGKLPFTTITFRVLDRRLVAGLKEGDSVAFVASRIGGENTLTSIDVVAKCQRFEHCQ